MVVLIVDSDPGALNVMATIVRRAGHRVECATSAEEALRMVRDGVAPRILLTGYIFPETTGLQLIRQIREQVPNLPVLITTTGAVECREDLARERVHVLQKPFVSAALKEAISEALAG